MKSLALLAVAIVASVLPFAQAWESALYPSSGGVYSRATVSGFKLADYSYAGYHAGEDPIPTPSVTHTVYPLSNQNNDATSHLQDAIDNAEGGVLFIAAGTYRVTDQLVIPSDTIVRGAGTVDSSTPTKIIMNKRSGTVAKSIFVGNRSPSTSPSFKRWEKNDGTSTSVVGSVSKGADTVQVSSSSFLSVGDWVLVGVETTNALRMEYNDGGTPWPENYAFRYLRKITAKSGTTLTLDFPVSHLLQSRDNPFVTKIDYLAEEIGIEDLSLGFLTPNDGLPWLYGNGSGGSGSNATYHNSRAISLGNVVNSWVRNVKTFSPDDDGFHVHSRGIGIDYSRWVTVEDCYVGPPAHRGGAGNGYLYPIGTSNHILVRNVIAQGGRHNFLFGSFNSDCVITGSASLDQLLTNDSHHSFNHQVLIDDMTVQGGYYSQGDAWQTMDRGSGSGGAGYTGGDVAFWNIRIVGSDKTMHSAQAAVNGSRGFIIGATRVRSGESTTTSSEWREGIGTEANLVPQSLYSTMLAQRLGVSTAPPTPTGLAASGGNGTVQLSWNVSSGATSYTVKRSTSSGGTYNTIQSGIGSTSYSDTSVSNGTTYYYVVSASNSSGESSNSSFVGATPQASPPPAPNGLVATGGNGQVALSWDASAGATSYAVKRSNSASGPFSTINSNVTQTSYADSSVSNGTTYYYVVAASNSVGNSPNSAVASAKPEAQSGLTIESYSASASDSNTPDRTLDNNLGTRWSSSGSPQWIKYKLDDDYIVRSISIAWYQGDSREAYFEVEVSSDNSNWTEVLPYTSSSGVTVEQELHDLVDTEARWVRIVGYGNELNDYTSITEVDIFGSSVSAPATPTGLSAVGSDGEVALTWVASSEATSYSVYRSTTSGSGYQLESSGTSSTSYTDTSLTNGMTYYYVVTASNAGGESSQSSQASATPTGGASVAVAWEFDSDTDGWVNGGNSLSSFQWTSGGYIDGTSNGDARIYSADNLNLNILSSNSIVKVRMKNNSSNTTGQIYFQVNGDSNFTGTQRKDFTTVANDSGYTEYTIDMSGVSGWSGTLKRLRLDPNQLTSSGSTFSVDYIRIQDDTPSAPPAPTGLAATDGNGQVSLSWSASTGATSYSVTRSTQSGGTFTNVETGIATLSYVDSSASNGTTYYYKVVAANSGGSSSPSNEVSATPQVPAPSAPTGLSATGGDGEISLSWSASSGATSYSVYRSTTSGTGYQLLDLGISGTSYLDTELSSGMTYYYVVTASNAGGESSQSPEASAVANGTSELATPDIAAITSSSENASNVDDNTVDGDLATRWSAEGQGEWIKYELSDDFIADEIFVSWHNGNTRKGNFRVEGSTDDTNWFELLPLTSSSGTTLELEGHDLLDSRCSYIRIVGYGYVSNDGQTTGGWTSITETVILGHEATDPVVDDTDASGYQTGHPPEDTVDANLSTRWSQDGYDEWIEYEFTSSFTVASLAIAWYNGDQRQGYFEVEGSTDGTNWTSILGSSASSGTSLDLETYDVSDLEVQWIRVLGYGNSVNGWNSINEVEFYGY